MRGRRQPASFGMRTHRVRLAGIRLTPARGEGSLVNWQSTGVKVRGTGFDSLGSHAVPGGLAESGKASVSKTVVGARAPRRFDSCILRWPLAQLEEQSTLTRRARGSSPRRLPKSPWSNGTRHRHPKPEMQV